MQIGDHTLRDQYQRGMFLWQLIVNRSEFAHECVRPHQETELERGLQMSEGSMVWSSVVHHAAKQGSRMQCNAKITGIVSSAAQ